MSDPSKSTALAIDLLRRLRHECWLKNNVRGWRILNAAMQHLLGRRPSTVCEEYDEDAI